MEYKRYDGEYTGVITGSRSGIVHTYSVLIPDVITDDPFALLVNMDGLNGAEAKAMAELVLTNEAPYCVVIGISGHSYLYPSFENGLKRDMRFNDYDIFSHEYVDFLVDEFIPYITEKFDLNISDSPDMHMISGGSSGGISAWNGVWFRNDYFRRAYMSSPTFSAMARGNMAPVMMRLFETKPIKVYTDYSEDEPDDYFGSSLCAAMEGQKALEFAGYDYKWAYHLGKGHCSHRENEESAKERMKFLWENWATEPVKPLRLSKRAEQIISLDDPWEKCEAFPQKTACITTNGEYKIKDNQIVFVRDGKEKIVSDGYINLTGIAVSSDLWRLYISDSAKGCVYAATISENGDLRDYQILCSLQMLTDFKYPGATDIVVDCKDRTFAATELGIQCIRSFGLIDVILPLPNNDIPLRVNMVGDILYADCGNAVYCRKTKTSTKEDPLEITLPKYTSYYN